MRFTLYFLLILTLFHSCTPSSNFGSATKEEELSMRIRERKNVINPQQLPEQQALSMTDRYLAESGQTRSILSPVAASLVSMASNAVKKVIANDQKKYLAKYQFGLTDLYFYDQLSSENAFDPVGLQFSGFRVIRTFKNNSGFVDTAMKAEFSLDTTNNSAMVNNSMFRLRLKEFQMNYAKAKVDDKNDQKLNMDVEITFLTSYVNSDGMLFDSVVLGKFYLFLRKMPLQRSDASYSTYYASLKDSLLTGKSFIVPRSFGYYRDVMGNMRPSYSQGSYSIQVKVVESSKENFVNKLVLENANLIIDAGTNQLKTKLKNL